MKKGRKNLLEKVFISEQEKMKMERKTRRQADIEFGITPYKTKVHKNKKAYSRKAKHKVSFFDQSELFLLYCSVIFLIIIRLYNKHLKKDNVQI